jgi:hypothetical protein
MQVLYQAFPAILPDNEMQYFSLLGAVVESIDEYAALRITHKPTGYSFILTPSEPRYTQVLLEEILQLHNLMNIRLSLSKSIRTTSTISFEITVTEAPA